MMSSHVIRPRKVFNTLIFVILTILAVNQAYESFQKYVKQQTMTSFASKPLEESKAIVFPSMTFCDINGYKEKQVQEIAGMSEYSLTKKEEMIWPNNESQVEKAWKEITFDVKDLLHGIGVRYNNGVYCNRLKSQNLDAKNCKDDVFRVKTLNSLHHGRCYTIEFSKKVQYFAFDNIVVTLKRKVNVFIHGPGQEIGLVANFFPVDFSVYQLEIGNVYRADFQAEQSFFDEVLGCNQGVTELEYYQCARRVISNQILEKSHEKEKICLVPMFDSIVSPQTLSSISYCTTTEQAVKAIKKGRKATRPLTQMGLPTKDCERPCSIRGYKFSPMINNEIHDESDGSSYIYINLNSNYTVIKEEIRVFDSNSIIGTIGGALGLFIGFSFFATIKDCLDHIESWCR